MDERPCGSRYRAWFAPDRWPRWFGATTYGSECSKHHGEEACRPNGRRGGIPDTCPWSRLSPGFRLLLRGFLFGFCASPIKGTMGCSHFIQGRTPGLTAFATCPFIAESNFVLFKCWTVAGTTLCSGGTSKHSAIDFFLRHVNAPAWIMRWLNTARKSGPLARATMTSFLHAISSH